MWVLTTTTNARWRTPAEARPVALGADIDAMCAAAAAGPATTASAARPPLREYPGARADRAASRLVAELHTRDSELDSPALGAVNEALWQALRGVLGPDRTVDDLEPEAWQAVIQRAVQRVLENPAAASLTDAQRDGVNLLAKQLAFDEDWRASLGE